MQLVLDILMVLLGLVMSFAGVHFYRMNRRCSKWPQVKGKWLSLEVGESALRRGSSKARFILEGEYEYEVDGKKYKSDRIHSMDSLHRKESTVAYLKSEAEKKKNAFLESSLIVTYNPMAPAESYLMATSYLWSFIAIAGGVLVIFIGLGRLLV